jgi:hypothetical protein
MTTATKIVAAPDAFEIVGEFTYEADYSVQGESRGPRYPWVQADCAQPQSATQTVKFGLSADSLKNVQGEIPGDMGRAMFPGGEVDFLVPSVDVRWVILARPRLFAMVKTETPESQGREGDVFPLTKGMRERGEITASLVLLGCVVGGDFIRDADGEIQVFTLKLTSTKTNWVGGLKEKDLGVSRFIDAVKSKDFGESQARTIESFNQKLVQMQNGRSNHWLGHTASIRIGVVAKAIPTSDGKKQSLSNIFCFEPGSGAAMLPPALAKASFEFVSTPEFKSLAANPFDKSGTTSIATPQPVSMAVDDEEMPF